MLIILRVPRGPYIKCLETCEADQSSAKTPRMLFRSIDAAASVLRAMLRKIAGTTTKVANVSGAIYGFRACSTAKARAIG